MSLRNSLKEAIDSTQEKCCAVALPRGCNNATNDEKEATTQATISSTTPLESSTINHSHATPHATNVQQALKMHATNVQQHTSVVIHEKNVLLIQSWLFQIGEPEQDHFLVLNKCRSDPEAMEYFLKHARGD